MSSITPSTVESADRTSLRAAARAGSRWTAIQFGGARLSSFLVFLALARLLSPADFGIVAIATVFVFVLQILIDGGFSQALVQRSKVEPGHLDTAFWTSVGLGMTLALGFAAAAPLLADGYDQPALRWVVPALAVGLVISSLGSTQSAQLRRDLRFKPLAVRAVSSNVAGGVVGVALALMGAEVWALVGQFLTLNLMQTVLLWVATSWRPGRRASRRHFRELFGFSRHSVANQLLNAGLQRTDDLLIGIYLGPVSLGIYGVAYRLQSTFNDVINQMMLGVAFPVFARMQQDRIRLGRAYLQVLKVGLVISFPTYLFFTVAAPDVVRVLFGDRWAAAGPVMTVLAMYGAIQTALAISDSCLTGVGRPEAVTRIRVITLVVQVCSFVVAAQFGLIWVAASLVARAYLLAPMSVYFLAQAGIVTWRAWVAAFVTPVFATASMLAVTWAVRSWVVSELPAVARLAVMLVVAVAVYVVAVFVIDRSMLGEVRALLRAKRSKKKANEPPGTSPDKSASPNRHRGSQPRV